jgi:hypothetical protein
MTLKERERESARESESERERKREREKERKNAPMLSRRPRGFASDATTLLPTTYCA